VNHVIMVRVIGMKQTGVNAVPDDRICPITYGLNDRYCLRGIE
jgi:hypothetical protein